VEYCQHNGMQLPTLKTIDELQQLGQQLTQEEFGKTRDFPRGLAIFWMSARDIDGATPKQYLWADGSPVDNALWLYGEPNSVIAGQDTCVLYHYSGSNARLWETDCGQTGTNIMCEVQATSSACS
jgi:hypothetical protein